MFVRKYEFKTIFITFIFLNMDISVTFKDFKMKFSMHVLEVLLEGNMPQIFYLGLSFYFM